MLEMLGWYELFWSGSYSFCIQRMVFSSKLSHLYLMKVYVSNFKYIRLRLLWIWIATNIASSTIKDWRYNQLDIMSTRRST
jgi:hypothetical protein